MPTSESQTRSTDLTRLFRILADETRFRLLRLLWKEELTVNELAEITQLAQPRISNHLKILREENFITERRSGSWRHYSLKTEKISGFAEIIWPALEDVWKNDHLYRADDKRLTSVLTHRDNGNEGNFFDQLSTQWDEIRDSLFGDALGREILRAFLPEDLTVADIGTGTGYTLSLFARKAKKLIAIDHSEAMLEQTENRMKAMGIKNIEYRLADIQESFLKESEADVITIVQVLHHIKNPEQVLIQAAKGMKKEGWLIISDFMNHEEMWLKEKLKHQWLGFSREQIIGYFQELDLDMIHEELLPGRTYMSDEGHRLNVPDSFIIVGKRKSP